MELPKLYLITDRSACASGAFLSTVEAALRGGVKLVQLREKDLSARELLGLANELRELTRAWGARLLINDRADIAMLCGADGVHLTSISYPASSARELLGKEGIIGVSTHSVKEARLAESQGADFVTFGPVYHTPSKAMYGEPLGVEELEKAVRALSIPVYALGGINIENIGEAASTGAYAALIRALLSCVDAEGAARELLTGMQAIDKEIR
ncbi:MAG TPA: thiamine phosphate synthase [Deltaproteobacteria bacterium]|nr:MAG: thiamine-phosphate diphosphorylase [Deltaproteobacteria bacterium GWA2_55_82]OGQ62730.1 MAG: thiamine-phosphate diphosphorylase [Deltaproteobacteria bacterium RIFCSPLOWO2_02_FULL_55_12]OIJ75108.1 MAG: thiamine-phosphate diphosphorylase [Deltaproteobacteria bacterium GWC2_55_46]HBG46796.1 thiamine phosphate synthase [Deltaproteobacteria bacterium]HCY11195.1 thiamine phosphate synthase [Deltaproteobacteria bacterium]